MPNLVPLVEIDLDKPRHLRLTLHSMVAFEQAMGKGIETVDPIKPTVSDMEALLWACLLPEDPDLTLEEAGNLVDVNNIIEVGDAIKRAFAVAIPTPTSGMQPPKNRRRSTGSRSGPSGGTTSD